MNPITGLLAFIPNWVLPALLAASMAHGCITSHQRDTARVDLANLKTAAANQKVEAGKKLADETARVTATQHQLELALMVQEKNDASNKTLVSSLGDRLRSAAGPAGRLRDPNATGCGRRGDSAEGATATAASNSAGNPAETGGLLSPQLTGLLTERLTEADAINVAYISCKADSFNIRSIR